MQITDYHAKYYAHELTKRCPSDSVEKLTASLFDAQVDLNPHQVEAALFAFKSPFSTGAILADEVGLGKTIEAGIVLSQMWAEQKHRVLIIVPSSLRKQWNQELTEKFFLPSEILESKPFNDCIKGGVANPFQRDKIVICSYHFARNKADYAGKVKWDLVIFDEAHRLRNVYKPENKIARTLKDALGRYPKLLLTATPLQNSLLELYGLVSFIDEYTFGDLKSFKNQYARITTQDTFAELKARLTPICKRTLRRQVLEYVKYTNRIPITQEFVPTKEEERLYDLVSDYLRRPNLQALPASQRSLMTLVLRKLLASSTFAIAGALNTLIRRLEARLKNAKLVDPGAELSMDFEGLDEIRDEWNDEDADGPVQEQMTKENAEAIAQEIKDLKEFRVLAESIVQNAKGRALIKALKAGFDKAVSLGASKKAVIFTESCRTQEYLMRLLSNTEYALPAPRPGVFYVYVIECDDGSHYIGQTDDLQRRWPEHQAGTAADWTAQHKPVKIVHHEELHSRDEAVEREKWLKTGYGREWIRREIKAGRARQAGDKFVLFNGQNSHPQAKQIYGDWFKKHEGTDLISGSKTADLRASLVDHFRDTAQILIATEAAAEGINLQFCSLVVNYDLPWNPQRIEQRIGRCHRYGQKHDVVVVNFLNKKNAADQRVYQLLAEKFQLFSGVFGASDEVLGSIESGVDFEKRIVAIYQTCRTQAEIEASFDQLQKDLSGEIDETLKVTRQQLLENFDEEVHEKLRVNLQASRDYLNRYESLLWRLTAHALANNAAIDESALTFDLTANPFSTNSIPLGRYRFGREVSDAHHYRFAHPLAQQILRNYKERQLPGAEVCFDYSASPTQITVLKPLVKKSGWLKLHQLTIASFEAEDHLLWAGITDDGQMLSDEQCRRLFSLAATSGKTSYTALSDESALKRILQGCEKNILQNNAERNAGFFDAEMGKLEHWSEDMKTSLEIKLKQLDIDVKMRKAEARKITNLEEKVKAHREIKDLEKSRNDMRLNLYQAQDDVERQKERLIEQIEARLKQDVKTTDIFTVRWRML